VVNVISRFRVRNGLQEQVGQAFLNRPRLVEKAAGFCGLEVLTDAQDPAVFFLVTRWTDEASFRAWHSSEAHHQSHAFIPAGLKLDATYTSLSVANRIEDPAGVQNLSDALEGQTVALSDWLMDSDAVFALLLAPDGTIRARNRAADRIFPTGQSKNFGCTIWDYLVCSDTQPLRQQLSDLGGRQHGCILLNLTGGQRNPVTLEVGLVRCSGSILLLGTHEYRRDADFRTEILQQTSDLSVMMRDAAQKNRELRNANETIQRLASTDALTGLANRRSLHEALEREIARAGRMGEHLSVIMADLDHFKSINDDYGHTIGDLVLASAASVFSRQSRPYDLAARYGGEEFFLLVPGASTENAIGIAERIRKEIAEIKVPGCPRQITVSLGVATWMPSEASQHFISRADQALYRAKNEGRNRVEAAPDKRHK
jgi:diguanylate cyclase (GGDEF)-like protein